MADMTEAERTAAANKAAADAKARQEEANKLREEHGKLAEQAAKDRAEAEKGKLTPEQVKAAESAQKADDAAAKAAEAERKAHAAIAPATVADAKVSAPVHPDMPAGSHFAQKFANDPENPKPASGNHADPELKTMRLSRSSPDHTGGLIHTSCHPEMVGDYLRAGWSLDEVQAGAYPLTKEEQAVADKKRAPATA